MTIGVTITQSDGPMPQSSVLVTGIVAQPGGQTAATPLTARKNIVVNVTPNSGVMLQVLPGVPEQQVFNRCGTGESLLAFPPEGMRIEGLGTNVPGEVSDAGNATFTWDGALTWLVS